MNAMLFGFKINNIYNYLKNAKLLETQKLFCLGSRYFIL